MMTHTLQKKIGDSSEMGFASDAVKLAIAKYLKQNIEENLPVGKSSEEKIHWLVSVEDSGGF